jgi:predicted GIY-YIG superfamily endonuclease
VRVAPSSDKPDSVAFLPYIGLTSNHISKVQSHHNIRSVGLLLKKITGALQLAKDDLGLIIPGVYSMPCKCGQVYIGQTGYLTETRLKEYPMI